MYISIYSKLPDTISPAQNHEPKTSEEILALTSKLKIIENVESVHLEYDKPDELEPMLRLIEAMAENKSIKTLRLTNLSILSLEEMKKVLFKINENKVLEELQTECVTNNEDLFHMVKDMAEPLKENLSLSKVMVGTSPGNMEMRTQLTLTKIMYVNQEVRKALGVKDLLIVEGALPMQPKPSEVGLSQETIDTFKPEIDRIVEKLKKQNEEKSSAKPKSETGGMQAQGEAAEVVMPISEEKPVEVQSKQATKETSGEKQQQDPVMHDSAGDASMAAETNSEDLAQSSRPSRSTKRVSATPAQPPKKRGKGGKKG